MTGPLTRATSISQADGFVVYSSSNIGFYYVPYDTVFEAFAASLDSAGQSEPTLITNLAISAYATANALVVTLNQADGVTSPTSSSGSSIAFGTTNTDAGSYTIVDITSALTLTIPQGATAGFTSNVPDSLYWYVLNNAGFPELAWSTEYLWSEGMLQTTTANTTASDSRTVLYSNTPRSNVPVRFIGKMDFTLTTAGNWLAPTNTMGPASTKSGVIRATRPASSAISLTSTVSADITSITLPPGVWDMSFGVCQLPAAATSFTLVRHSLSRVSGTLAAMSSGDPPNSSGEYTYRAPLNSPTVFGSVQGVWYTYPSYRIILTAQTTFYLVISSDFTVSTCNASGWVEARKVN